MPPPLDLFTYGVNLNWRVMWFSIRELDQRFPDAPRVRCGTASIARGGFSRPGEVKTHFELGKGDARDQRVEAPLSVSRNFEVIASLDIGIEASHLVEADLHLEIGEAKSQATVRVEPGARTPFMLCLRGPSVILDQGGNLNETAAVVDGVFDAEPRRGPPRSVRRLGR